MPTSRLSRLPVFQTLDESRLLRLEPWLEELDFGANQPVYRIGEAWDGLYAIRRGAVALRAERPGEAVGQGFHLGTGDLFGEAEAVNGTAREMTARALCRTSLLRIPPEALVDLLAENPTFGMLLRGLATQRRMVHVRHLLSSSTRKEPRIWLDREVELNLGAGKRFMAHLEDLSCGGACFASVPESWQVGTQVIFTLGVGGHPNLLQARGVVRWRDEALAGIAFEAGPMFRKQVDEALRVLTPLSAA
jgi:CRP-like cAMP-binding protein